MSRIGYRVFFPPQSLAIVVDRPDKGSGYDRTIDFELAVGVASSSTRNRNRQDDVRIVVAGELVTLRCEAGNCFENLTIQIEVGGWSAKCKTNINVRGR